jgi:integrase
MRFVPDWRIERGMILDRRELAGVLRDLERRARHSPNAWLNLVLVRLGCCVGLRASEIAGLRLRDLRVDDRRPIAHVRPQTAKGGRGRHVPLWWDAGTLADLVAWKQHRERQGATSDDRFLVSQQAGQRGQTLSRHALRRRFITACRALGPERAAEVTIHHARHSFISHALAGGRTLAEVRDAAGHTNVSVTSVYLHVAVDDDGKLGDLFAFAR